MSREAAIPVTKWEIFITRPQRNTAFANQRRGTDLKAKLIATINPMRAIPGAHAIWIAAVFTLPWVCNSSDRLAPQVVPPAAAGKVFAIVIGIENYFGSNIPPVPGARNDAVDFSAYVKQQKQIHIEPADVITIDGAKARMPWVKDALERTLEKAGPADTVYLFVSARGITEQFTHRGFVLAFETNAGNWQGTAIPVDWLSATFSRCRAHSIYLFADLCREPAGSNEIHTRLADLADVGPVKGILASKPNRPSMVINAGDPQKQAGLFSSVLIEALRSHNLNLQREYPQIFETVRGDVSKQSKGKQQPMRMAGVTGTSSFTNAYARPFPRLAGELAMLGMPGVSFLFQQGAQAARVTELRQRFLDAINDDRLIGPGGAYDIFENYSPLAPADVRQDDERLLATALEDGGQRAVAAYGSGEEFPNDPMRLDKDAFLAAATMFERIVTLKPLRRDAQARALFCRGRADLLTQNWAEAEHHFEQAWLISKAYPEPLNGLGVSYYEQTVTQGNPAPNIGALRAKAISNFREAIQLAPEWAYPRHNLALTLFAQGDYRAAQREYELAFRISPYHPYLSYNLGLFLQRQNRLKQAAASYGAAQVEFHRKILQLRSTSGEYARLLLPANGITDPAERKRYLRELDLNNRLIKALTDNEAEVHNALGTVREQRRDLTGADAQYQAAFALNPDLLEARHNLAMMDMDVYRKSHRSEMLKAALQLWQENLRRSPVHRPSLLGLAGAYRDSDNLTDAVALYQRILTTDPKQLEARAQLGLALAAAADPTAEKELQAAIQLLGAAQHTHHASLELHEALGKLYLKDNAAAACGQFELAREARAAGGNGKPPAWLKHEWRACKDRNDHSKADVK